MQKFDGVLLASGGLDSIVLAYKLLSEKKNIIILFLNYGQHFKEAEFTSLKRNLPKEFQKNIQVLNIEDIYKESTSNMITEPNLWTDDITSDDLYLPYRNTLFFTIAAAYSQARGITEIYSAFINSNHAKEIDCSLEFFTRLEDLLESYGSVKLIMPFRFLTKKEVIEIGLNFGAPIDKTYSCQANSKTPCGSCPNCVDRLDAMESILNKE